MGEAMLSRSLIQFSIDGWTCVPSLLFTWGQAVMEVMKIMVTSFKRSHAGTPTLSASCSRPPLTHASAGDSWILMGKSGSVSCGVTAPFSWFLVYKTFCVCLLKSVSLVLFKFWWLYGGLNGDLLQEGLCHTQVCCTQSPCPCGWSQLTHTSTWDSHTFKGTSDSVSVGFSTVHKVLFEPSKRLWQVWSLSLITILPPPTVLLGPLQCPWI